MWAVLHGPRKPHAHEQYDPLFKSCRHIRQLLKITGLCYWVLLNMSYMWAYACTRPLQHANRLGHAVISDIVCLCLSTCCCLQGGAYLTLL